MKYLGRMDRYSHEIEDDTDDTDDSPVFGLFSSCSPQYRKTHGSKLSLTSDSSSIKSSSLATTEVVTPEVSGNETKLKLKSAISLPPTSQDLALHKSTDSKKVTNTNFDKHRFKYFQLLRLRLIIQTAYLKIFIDLFRPFTLHNHDSRIITDR